MPLACTKCGTPLPGSVFRLGNEHRCPRCRVRTLGGFFPALSGVETAKAARPITVVEDQASCYYHARRVADSVCDRCGRFICSLCALDLRDRTVCPSCLEAGLDKETMPGLVSRRYLWDRLALYVAFLPIVFFPMWIFTAPGAIYLGIRYWKSPSSLLPRTKIRYILAVAAGVVELVLWFVWARMIYLDIVRS